MSRGGLDPPGPALPLISGISNFFHSSLHIKRTQKTLFFKFQLSAYKGGSNEILENKSVCAATIFMILTRDLCRNTEGFNIVLPYYEKFF